MDNDRVKSFLRALRERDTLLGSELQKKLEAGRPEAALLPEAAANRAHRFIPETIVLRTGRPVLAVRNDQVQIEIQEAESEVWRERLTRAQPKLLAPLRAVGRIEVEGHPDYSWVGTGWLVSDDVIVTNRHVAQAFARRANDGFVFKLGPDQRRMQAGIDFLCELGNTERRAFALQRVLHIEGDDGPDIAFLRVAPAAGLALPVPLAQQRAAPAQQVVVVGYPARDSRIPDAALMDELFGDVYDRKRVAPGQVTESSGSELRHDCSTLGGNSGSVVLDLASGQALGLHFAGRFLVSNYAVPAEVIAERLHAVTRGGAAQTLDRDRSSEPQSLPQGNLASSRRIEVTVPIRISVDIGDILPDPQAQAQARTAALALAPAGTGPQPDDADGGDGEPIAPEGRPEDYNDRKGYVPDFLGPGFTVPLPLPIRDGSQILRFDFGGRRDETELRYHHYSVLMHSQRRLCLFSAVNIDGQQSRRTQRGPWRLDPRIPEDRQIMKDCYGNAPRFSRGHMTRREDPAWGDPSLARLGNLDSMHVTNTVPQMQAFNAGIWLRLEDYALDHARQDDMRLCVLTGPVLRPDDPVRFKVQIPLQFWKVIAFIHDGSRQLSATGYSMSQRDFLKEEEFVFGAHQTHQRSLAWIEQEAGVSFGTLRGADRFKDSELAAPRPLSAPGQIRW